MGGGIAGNFGSTAGVSKEKILDSLSNFLTAASFVPGFDTFADLASIPVDLARGDIVSAGLSALGAIPFVGEIADTAKVARVVDKAIDSGKTIKKVGNFANFPKKIHIGKQGKHIVGHNNYTKGKSILNISIDKAQELVKKHSGTGKKIGTNRERVDFQRVIGKYVDPNTGKSYSTTVGTIHYSNTGTHIVPEKPIKWRK